MRQNSEKSLEDDRDGPIRAHRDLKGISAGRIDGELLDASAGVATTVLIIFRIVHSIYTQQLQ